MSLHVYTDIEQGSERWLELRRGIITASTIGQLITAKTLKSAANDSSRSLVAQLVAERITGRVEDTYSGGAMERGTLDEPYARELYAEHHAPVEEVGFIVREEPEYTVGYSPDGLVGDKGLIEIKSRDAKIHLKTVLAGEVNLEHVPQCQMALFVTGREWVDFISYSGGMALYVKRMYPDDAWQAAILETVTTFENTAANMIAAYLTATNGAPVAPYINHFEEMVI